MSESNTFNGNTSTQPQHIHEINPYTLLCRQCGVAEEFITDQLMVKIEIRGDITPRKPGMKPADVIKAVMNHGEIVRKVQAREYEVFDEEHLSDMKEAHEEWGRALGKYASSMCESQPPLSDFAAVLTAVMNLSEQEQQQVYEALYKKGCRIYRE